MIDNSPQAYAWQPQNGIPIISWYDDLRDKELNKLVSVLERLAQVDDVREYIPKILNRNSVNYYEALRVLKAPRESSPLDNFLSSWSNIKKNAKAFFGGNNVTEQSSDEEERRGDDEMPSAKDFSNVSIKT